ncbi:MAG: hypothetical protein IJZ23_04390 [Roseburia sp.]|nr:hypothetical protein [Roseburia sp.]
MEYLRDKIVEECQKALEKPADFYKKNFINYRGKTTDTEEYYTEVIAEFLCNNIEAFSNIPTITRKATYKTKSHTGACSNCSNRVEENIAKKIYNQTMGKKLDFVGRIIDYQTPLKNVIKDEVGKIDLLSISEDTLYILELKKEDSEETMLRCVLEGYTYMKTANLEKLKLNFDVSHIKNVKACPFVFRNGAQYKEMFEERPHLFELMKLLDSKPYYLRLENGEYIVTED